MGDENIFICGMTVEEVADLWKKVYDPSAYLAADDELRAVVDWVGSNFFTPDEPHGVFTMLRDNLVHHDPYLCLPDFRSYSDVQLRVDAAYRDRARWSRMAILNTARMGKFSSDRTISEYAREIWKLDPVRV